MSPLLVTGAIVFVVVATFAISAYGLRISRTTSDFFVASRTVRPIWNASAISGEYLSAGTFLGLSGLVLLSGSDAFWFPIGYAAGYLLVLVFVAAPLRRSGAYTIPDFIHARLDSVTARRVTSVLVMAIGWLYIVPQFQGAALALNVVAGIPPWVGAVTVAIVVAGSVAAGGMRSITFVQAFLFWLKLAALAVPVLFFLIAFGPHEPDLTLAEWAGSRLGKPALDAVIEIPGGKLVVRRLESGRIAAMGLQIDELLQVEPDERLLARLEAEGDELGPIRRWLARLRPRRAV